MSELHLFKLNIENRETSIQAVLLCLFYLVLSFFILRAKTVTQDTYIPKNPRGQLVKTAISFADGEGLYQKRFQDLDKALSTYTSGPGQSYLQSELPFNSSPSTWEPSLYQDIFSVSTSGKLTPKHPWFVSLVASPFYSIAGLPGVWFFNQLLLAGFFVSGFLLLREHDKSLFPFIFAFSFPLLLFQTVFFARAGLSHDLFAAFTIVLAFAAVRTCPSLAMLLFGISAYCRVTNLSFLPFLLIYNHFGENRSLASLRQKLRSFTVLFIVVLPLFLTNLIIWGSPISGSYSRLPVYEHGERVFGHSKNDHFFDFKIAIDHGMSRVTEGRDGLLRNLPIFIFTFPLAMLLFWLGKKRDFYLLFGAAVFQSLLYLSFNHWEGAVGWRFVLVAGMFMAVVLGRCIGDICSSRV